MKVGKARNIFITSVQDKKLEKDARRGFDGSYHNSNQTLMQYSNAIREQLRPHLGWHGARLSFIALFIIALFRAKTVNLAELATVWGGRTAEASNYKRMQRFFRSFEIEMDKFALMVMSMAQIPQPWVLSIDRTNWSFGQTHFNILMLSVVHEGIGYPLMWTMLKKKKGNSNSEERMDLLERFLLPSFLR